MRREAAVDRPCLSSGQIGRNGEAASEHNVQQQAQLLWRHSWPPIPSAFDISHTSNQDAASASNVNYANYGKQNQIGQVSKRIARQGLVQAVVLRAVHASKPRQFDAPCSLAKTASAGKRHLAKTRRRFHFVRGTRSYKRSSREAAEL